MKTLLITILFVCAYGITSFAQEKTESMEKAPKIHTSKKASKKVFPSAVERKSSEATNSQKEISKRESDFLPSKSRKITDPKLVEKRKEEKEKSAKTKKHKPSKETLNK